MKCLIVGLASFAASRSSAFDTDLIVFQLGISTSLDFKIETSLYFSGIANLPLPNKPKHSMFSFMISPPTFVLLCRITISSSGDMNMLVFILRSVIDVIIYVLSEMLSSSLEET